MTTPPSTTVLKAFDLLTLFSERPLLGAGEAARLLGTPRASTHRLLVTLREAGVLEVNDDGQYRLGLLLFELGSYAPLRRRLHDECTQPLERLSAEVALPAFLAAREGTELLCLEKIYHPRTDVPIRVGQRAPLHATAAGKVLLAYSRRSAIERYLSEPLTRFTPHTIVDPRKLNQELERIRDQGLATEREESYVGIASIATGVWNHTGKIVAAISIAAATPAGQPAAEGSRTAVDVGGWRDPPQAWLEPRRAF
ncbi:MAG: helix-turn-helix domain-containing protein [Actinophytocola sp.]|nr:helix-turn-helix domain-containing protein [Actinophytocola sp.]